MTDDKCTSCKRTFVREVERASADLCTPCFRARQMSDDTLRYFAPMAGCVSERMELVRRQQPEGSAHA